MRLATRTEPGCPGKVADGLDSLNPLSSTGDAEVARHNAKTVATVEVFILLLSTWTVVDG